MLVPSSIYTDRGAIELRDLFVNNSRWEWLFGFENRKGIFNIHRSFKFCPIIVEKGGQTEAIKTAFMRRNLEEWENQTPNIIPYPREQVERFSPQSKALLEICTRRDLEVLEKIYDDSVRLGDQAPNCWDVKYTQGEFNMTSDSYLFPPLEWWQELGYCPDRYGRWLPPQEGTPKLIYKGKKIGPDGDIALPLYEGRMISQFDFSSKEWKTGKGRGAIWETIPYTQKEFKPQYLLSSSTCAGWSTPVFGIKIPIMNISSATNTRTVICAITKDYPCNHALNPVRELGSNLLDHLILTGVFNSFVYDTLVRNKMGGLNLSFFILDETAVPKKKIFHEDIYAISAQLSFIHEFFSPEWIRLRSLIPALTIKNWKSLWAVTPHERLRLRCILDAVAAELYGLDYDDFAWILKECAYPVDTIRKNSSTFNPKGFWRVDKEKPPELRHTVLALRAFKDLKAMGLDAFLALNDGEGWMLPEDITYSVKDDDTIAFDEAGGTTAPVRSRLGERFLPWQLEGTPEESWAECERHARNILGEEGFRKLTEELEDNHDPISDDDVATGPRPAGNPSGNMSLKDFMGGR